MRILIIEDEERSFMRLRRLLLQIDETFEISGPITSVSEATEALSEANKAIKASANISEGYDMIFADIRLDDGEVFDAFLQAMPKVPVIFTTAYNEYALDAFRSNGIAYLLKPIVPSDLAEAVEKAKLFLEGIKRNEEAKNGDHPNARAEDANGQNALAQQGMSMDYTNLLKSFGLHPKPQAYREHFLVQNNNGYTVLNVQDINHICTENGITRAFLHNGRSMALGYSLNEIEAQLDPAKFFRANRQYIIGIDSIERIHFLFASKLSVRLKTYPDVEVIVSKEKATQLKEWIDK